MTGARELTRREKEGARKGGLLVRRGGGGGVRQPHKDQKYNLIRKWVEIKYHRKTPETIKNMKAINN